MSVSVRWTASRKGVFIDSSHGVTLRVTATELARPRFGNHRCALLVGLPDHEALNIDWSEREEDEGPELDIGLTMWVLEGIVEVTTYLKEHRDELAQIPDVVQPT